MPPAGATPGEQPPMIPPITKFSTNSARRRPGSPARHDPDTHPMDAEGQAAEYPEPEKIQVSIPHAGGFENAVRAARRWRRAKQPVLKNSLTASVLVIGSTSIPASIIPGKLKRAQGLMKSPAKRTIPAIPVRCSATSVVRSPSVFPAGPPHSGGGCRTPALPAWPSDIPITGRSAWR